jgi:protein tyrosine phosphatase (PTP) superfamily phosphohydrolase (DUF442 family)
MTLTTPHSRLRGINILSCLMVVSSLLLADDQPAPLPSITGVENLRQVAPGLLSGSQPEGSAAFEELAKRGVKVIISVDGATPDVEAAHQFGLRYVHVPIGYDKIKPQQRADLVAAVKTANGTVFMHCHHGKHRGPAAAAYCGIAVGKLSTEEALDVLKAAGTRADYTGLWDAVRKFEPPTVPAGPLVEAAQVEPLTGAMVRVDHHWTGIESQIKTGSITEVKVFASETLLLAEEFRELPRTTPSADEKYTDEKFKARLQEAITATEELHKASEKNDFAAIQTASKRVTQSCVDCHARYRNE